MRITAVEVFGVECGLPAPLRWGTMEVATKGGVLVRVRTDEGLEGLGEAGFSIAYLSRVAPVIRDLLAPLLIGEDPRLIGRLWHPHVRRHARLGTTRHPRPTPFPASTSPSGTCWARRAAGRSASCSVPRTGS